MTQTSEAGRAVYQIDSITRWGRNTGQRAAKPAERPPQPQPQPQPVPVRPVRAAAVGAVEGRVLLTLDLVAVVAVSLAAGSSWVTTPLRAIATTLAFAIAGLYRGRLQFSVLDDLPRVVVAVVAVGGVALAWPTGATPRALATTSVVWAAALVAAVVSGRVVGYALLRRHRRRSPGRATIVVGSGDIAMRIAEALREDRAFGLAPVGFVGPPTLTHAKLPVLAPASQLERAVARYKPLHLIVAFPTTPDGDLVTTLRRCRRYGVTVHVVPRLFELGIARESTELVRGIPLARLQPEPAQTRRWAVKRLVDIVGAAVGLVVLSPVLALCALAVRWESGRHGVLFRQERVGLDGKPFTIAKFRSLTPTSDVESQVKWNISTDVRLGPVGRLLRLSSLDELPQLVNVLRGDMSLVGPRPERPFFVQQFQRTYAGYVDRHRVPAGITGWAQIHGLRGDTSIEERVRFDNHYIEHWSLALDLKIMLRTLSSMLRHGG